MRKRLIGLCHFIHSKNGEEGQQFHYTADVFAYDYIDVHALPSSTHCLDVAEWALTSHAG